jgi:hypothetical protein
VQTRSNGGLNSLQPWLLPSPRNAACWYRSWLHLYATLVEKERRLISERTKAALAAKACGRVWAWQTGERTGRG